MGSLSLPVVCGQLLTGAATFGGLLAKGEISPARAWVGMRGAARYMRAVAAGDVAEGGAVAERLAVCRGCPGAVPDADLGDDAMWCGGPGAEVGPDGMPTCGCLLPAKASVGSETCPRASWPSVPPGPPAGK